MDILAPRTVASLRVLVLGAAPSDEAVLGRLFAAADLCIDLVRTRDEALQRFLDCGGHDGVFAIGAETEEMRQTLQQLCQVDPQLSFGHSATLPTHVQVDDLAVRIAKRRHGR